MDMMVKSVIPPADTFLLKQKDWVRLNCLQRFQRTFEGIYTAGGTVIGQVYVPDVYYNRLYGVDVLILLDPILDGKPFIILCEDIVRIEIMRMSVLDD